MTKRKSVPSYNFSAADAAFLYLERKDIPLHIASVCIFDGAIPFKQFVASIKSKLPQVPLYQKIPMVPAWSLEFPKWHDDPNFDIRRHIFHVRLEPPGDEAALEALAGKLLSQVLDRNKPLWEMHVIDGLKDGRGAIIWRVHHSLCDGVSGAELMKKILDESPEGALKRRRANGRPMHAETEENDLVEGISKAVTSALGNLVSLEAGLLDFAQGFLGAKDKSPLKGLVDILPEYAASVERLPFNKPCTGARKFCWGEISMAGVQKVREAAGGTVNDVVLTVLARALARYVKLHGESAAGGPKRWDWEPNFVSAQSATVGRARAGGDTARDLAKNGNVEEIRRAGTGGPRCEMARDGAAPDSGAVLAEYSGLHPAAAALHHDLHECGGIGDATLCRRPEDDCGISAGADGLRSGNRSGGP